MNYKIYLILFSFLILVSCKYDSKNNSVQFSPEKKYKNSGFTLVYDDDLKKEKKITKKLDNRSLLIFHKSLSKGSFVKITNPLNQKSLIAKVLLRILAGGIADDIRESDSDVDKND